jgi:hypothetical protein
MEQEIEVKIRIRVTDEQLADAGLSADQFAQNIFLFEHKFDIPSIVLSQHEDEYETVAHWGASIINASVIKPPSIPSCKQRVDKNLRIISSFYFKRTSADGEETGCAFLGERLGSWCAIWCDSLHVEENMEEIWYMGPSYDDLLVSFRQCMRQKLKEGYHSPTNLTTEEIDVSLLNQTESDTKHFKWVYTE